MPLQLSVFNKMCSVSDSVALSLPVCLRSRGLLLLRPPDAVVAAPADGRAGLRWNALLLCGGEDGELLYRFAGTVDSCLFFVEASRDEGGPLDMQKSFFLLRYHRCCFFIIVLHYYVV